VIVGLGCLVFLGPLAIGYQVSTWHLYWTEPDQARMSRDTASLRDVIRVLEQMQVQQFRNQDWCRNITYAGGSFSNSLEDTCNVFGAQPHDFTPEANAALARVADALNASGVWVYFVLQVEYDDAGRLTHAEFDLAEAPWRFDRWSYVYAPGEPLPPDMPNDEIYTRIDSDWYYHWGDWM
jgi:hypothetical protein